MRRLLTLILLLVDLEEAAAIEAAAEGGAGTAVEQARAGGRGS